MLRCLLHHPSPALLLLVRLPLIRLPSLWPRSRISASLLAAHSDFLRTCLPSKAASMELRAMMQLLLSPAGRRRLLMRLRLPLLVLLRIRQCLLTSPPLRLPPTIRLLVRCRDSPSTLPQTSSSSRTEHRCRTGCCIRAARSPLPRLLSLRTLPWSVACSLFAGPVVV